MPAWTPNTSAVRVSRTTSVCCACDELIYVNTAIRRSYRGSWQHEDCGRIERRRRMRRSIADVITTL